MTLAAPRVTIATVTYNSARHIAASIESALCQSYTDFELLICDDASTDDTWEIIQRYSDPRIRAIRNPRNLREYPNRNQALALARGEFLVYLDGDDVMYPHGLEFMVRMLAAFPSSATALAQRLTRRYIYPVELSPRQSYLCSFLGEAFGGSGLERYLFRTDILRKVGGFDTRFRTGDGYIHDRLTLEYPVVLINDGLIWWREHEGQATASVMRDDAGWSDAIIFRPEMLAHPACPLSAEEREVALANVYGAFLRVVARRAMHGRPKHALDMIRKAKLPASAWRYAAVPARRDRMNEVSATWPLQTDWSKHPFAKPPR